MIKQVINVDNYWKIIVYYNVDYNLFSYIAKDLYNIEVSNKLIKRTFYNMYNHKAKAVTISSQYYKTSIVLFNKHKSKYDYLNSIIHEAEHIKQAMLKAYNVEDENEPPAYTIGFIGMKMLESKLIKNLTLNNM